MELKTDALFNNRYLLLELKGRGSFGEVWLARDEQLDMNVAVKVYIALDDRGIDEFKKEYKTAYNLNHPNLLHAQHFDICDKRPFLVMPYCPTSATSLIGCCSEEMLWQFIRDTASGLSYLHSMDIVHHDIKPDNILITEDGNFAITDFGISTKMRSTLRRNSTRSMNQNSSGGSLPYMGPEMFTSHAESVKATDIWAFGVTLYELITGELPFFGQGGVMMLNGAEIPEINYPDKNIVSLVKACLSKETWDRPTAEEIVKMAETKSFTGKQKATPKKKDEKKTVKYTESPQSGFDIRESAPDEETSARAVATPAMSRHWLVNTMIILNIIIAVLAAILCIYDVSYSYYSKSTSIRFIGFMSIIAAAGGILLWKNRRMGFWMLIVAEITACLISLSICMDFYRSGLVPVVLATIIICDIAAMLIRKNGISAWKQTNYKSIGKTYTVGTGLVALVLSILIFALPSRMQMEAKEYLPEYNRCVENCRRVIQSDEPDVKNLISAKRDFLKLSGYENEYGRINKNYNKSYSIRPELQYKLQTESEKWSKAAAMQRRLGNKSKAEEFEKLASQLSL